MSTFSSTLQRGGRIRLDARRPGFVLLCFTLALWFGAGAARAATPVSGTLSVGNPNLNWSGTIFGAGAAESQCVEGVSCDTFQITLAPGDYTGKRILVQVSSGIPVNDYDLYIHKDRAAGPVAAFDNGPAPPSLAVCYLSIEPPVVTVARRWVAHNVCASVAPASTYNGVASLVPVQATVQASYTTGSLPFSHNVPLFARGTVRDLEPSIRVDVRGNCYVGGIRGVPAGVDMWRLDLNPNSPTFDPELRNAFYLGQPDVFQQQGPQDSTAGGADGGGDIDFATSVPASPDSAPVLTMVSLALANISSSASFDRGQSWQHQPAAAQVAADDRQWIESYGPNTVYLFYRAPIPLSGLFVQKSTDHGITYGPPSLVDPGLGSTPGYIAVDQATGWLYVSHSSSSAMFVSRSSDGGATWANTTVDNSTTHGHLFDPVKVGNDGTVYACWSNERHVYFAYSTDHAVSFSSPIQVDDPAGTQTNVLPWMDAGDAGCVNFAWFGTTGINTNADNWHVIFSQTRDALSGAPHLAQQVVSDHYIHGSNISEGGLGGAGNRNLGDYFQIAHDTQGAAVIAFADDHNDADGATYVVRQLGGTGLLTAANGNGQVAPVSSTELPVYHQSLPEVIDPVHDALARLQPIPTDSPFDIVSIKYFSDNLGPNAPYIGARMKLSGLTTMPPGGNWRMVMCANAPGIHDQRPLYVADHGDYFYLLASDTTATPTFTYGIGYRDSVPTLPSPAGSPYAMAYSFRGYADSGSVDSVAGVVTVKVSLAKLNALMPPGHPPIGIGSWLAGLRGTAAGPNGVPGDGTRGGRYNFLLQALDPAASPEPARGWPLALSALESPAKGRVRLRFSVPDAGVMSLGVYDVTGRLVRTLENGKVAAGEHQALWDGRVSGGARAASGIYFLRLAAHWDERVARVVFMN